MIGYYRKFVPRFADISRALTVLTKKNAEFKWTEQCQKSFELLKEALMKEPILKYPDPHEEYILYTDASKYAWAGALTQEYQYDRDSGKISINHPITYVSGLFKGSQLNWAALTKEAYKIYMCVKKLNYYLEDASIILMCDHLPLKKFLKRNTLNSKVNNWAVELSAHQIEFKYTKGIKNTLADTMSRLIQINPEIILPEEEEGKEYGYAIFEPLPPLPTMEEIITMTGRLKPKKNIEIHNPQVIRKQSHEEKCEEKIESTTEINATDTQSAAPIKSDNDPIILPDEEIKLPIEDNKLHQMQRKDKFCSNIIQQLETGKLSSGNPYYLEEGILKRYVDDHKQRFEVIVLPRDLAPVTLRLAHEEMGHNGIPRTYALLRRLYY